MEMQFAEMNLWSVCDRGGSVLKKKFLLLWLSAAAVVTVARVLHAADLGYDISLQMQAAQHLMEGKGLSIYSRAGEDDLARPCKLVTLTGFPCGYSFCAAMLLGIGFSVAGTLKAYGAVGTIFGWWGWGNLAYAFFKEGFDCGRIWRWAGFAVAISTPLLFTPPWNGTDIFLWAAVPWVLGWLVRASDENAPAGAWLDLLAGVVCGFSVLMRYAGLFLPLYAGLLIYCQSKGSLKVFARRSVFFGAGLLPCIVIQLCLIRFGSSGGARPGSVTFAASGDFWNPLWFLTSANESVVWWMPSKIHLGLTQSGERAPWLLAVALIVFALPVFFAIRMNRHRLIAAARDVRTAAVGLFLILPLFLFACALIGHVYVGIGRYYVPLIPVAIFVAYALAVAGRKSDSRLQRLLRITSVAYLAAYLFMSLVGVALLLLPGERAAGRRATFAGTTELCLWHFSKIIYESSAAREYVLGLLKEEPGTILVTNKGDWFHVDPSVDRSQVHSMMTMRASYVSGPAHILILVEEALGAPADALSLYLFNWVESDGRALRANFENLPNLRLLRRFPEEHVKILEARLPDGSQIPIKKRSAN